MKIVEFSLINANQKIDMSIVCGLNKAALGQVRPLILMLGPIPNSVIACGQLLCTRFHTDFINFENFASRLSIS